MLTLTSPQSTFGNPDAVPVSYLQDSMIQVKKGAMTVGGAGVLGYTGTSSTAIYTGTIELDGTNFTFNSSANQILSRVPVAVSGGGTFAHTGTGTLTIAAGATVKPTSVYIGAGSHLEIFGGAEVTFGDTVPSMPASVFDIATIDLGLTTGDAGHLIFSRANHALTFTGQIVGAGKVTKDGAATVVLTGNHTYTGETKVDAGELRITGGLGTRYDAVTPTLIAERNYTGGINIAASGATLRFFGPDLVGLGGARIVQELSARISGAPGSKFIVDGGRSVEISSDWDNTPTQYAVPSHNNFLGDLEVLGTNAVAGKPDSYLRITGRLDVQTEQFNGSNPASWPVPTRARTTTATCTSRTAARLSLLMVGIGR